MSISPRLALVKSVCSAAAALACVTATQADCPVSTYAPPRSTFAAGDEGWTLTNAAQSSSFGFPSWAGGTVGLTAFRGPGQLYYFARIEDGSVSDSWYFRAPAAFRGDHRAVHHGKLRFVLATFAAERATRDVYLRGAGLLLVHPITFEANSGFSNDVPVTLDLDAAGGWRMADTDQPVTRAQWEAVLGNVQDLQIPATWRDTPGTHAVLRIYAEYELPASGLVRVSDPDPDFGRVRVGRTRRKRLIIANRSRRETLYVHIGALPSTDFFTDHAGEDIDIPPRRHLKLHVGFVPALPGPVAADLPITTSDPDFREICLRLTGVGR
jgi:hypothetical protein